MASAQFPLQDRVAFVTGAAQGLGRAIALGFAAAGARVALVDRSAAVADTAQQLRCDGRDVMAAQADVSDEASLLAAFQHAVQSFGAVDVMVNNAALTPTSSMWDIDAREWDEVMAVNLRGCFWGCRMAGRHMQERGQGGRIINMASMAGQQPSAVTGVHYAASKAGILAVTRSFAQALAPHRITVNALAPAAVRSEALDALPPASRQALQASVPVGRFGEPDEVAAAAIYLASAAGAFVTGATLDINGGRFMR